MNQSIKIGAFNCFNYKSNQLATDKFIISNDITFISEHWLDVKEEFILNKFKDEYHVIYHATYDNYNSKYGRPNGGTCWFINKQIQLISHEDLDPDDHRFSKIRIKDPSSDFIDIIGVWLIYDDGTNEAISTFQSNLSLMAGHLKSTNHKNNIIIGDFNASFERGNRFDSNLREFVNGQILLTVTNILKIMSSLLTPKANTNQRLIIV